jgi:hypothetical protein
MECPSVAFKADSLSETASLGSQSWRIWDAPSCECTLRVTGFATQCQNVSDKFLRANTTARDGRPTSAVKVQPCQILLRGICGRCLPLPAEHADPRSLDCRIVHDATPQALFEGWNPLKFGAVPHPQPPVDRFRPSVASGDFETASVEGGHNALDCRHQRRFEEGPRSTPPFLWQDGEVEEVEGKAHDDEHELVNEPKVIQREGNRRRRRRLVVRPIPRATFDILDHVGALSLAQTVRFDAVCECSRFDRQRSRSGRGAIRQRSTEQVGDRPGIGSLAVSFRSARPSHRTLGQRESERRQVC